MNVQGIRIEKPAPDEPPRGLASVPPERFLMSGLVFSLSILLSAFSVALALMAYLRR